MKLMDKQEVSVGKSFLPNAPLVEVFFELRWKLQGDAQTPLPFLVDPGYQILVGNFIADAMKYGFTVVKEIEQGKRSMTSENLREIMELNKR